MKKLFSWVFKSDGDIESTDEKSSRVCYLCEHTAVVFKDSGGWYQLIEGRKFHIPWYQLAVDRTQYVCDKCFNYPVTGITGWFFKKKGKCLYCGYYKKAEQGKGECLFGPRWESVTDDHYCANFSIAIAKFE